MNRPILRLLLSTLLVALLATPVVLKRLSGRQAATGASPESAAVMARYGFLFQEVAKTAGIEFTHQAPRLDAKLEHIMPQVASMGAERFRMWRPTWEWRT
jgi:enediyne biosynthesis protein E4